MGYLRSISTNTNFARCIFDNSSDCIYNVGDDEIVRTISLTFLNQRVFHNGQCVDTVHIQDQNEGQGLLFFIQDSNESCCSLICCGHLPGGYLQVAGSINCHILKVQCSKHQPVVDVKTSPKLAYNNYCQDLRT